MRVQAAVPAVQPGRRGWAWAGAPGRQLMPADLSWAEPEWPGPPALGPVPGVKLPMTLPLLRELGPLPEETSCPQAFFSLKNMVMSFRVSDLQMLLGFVGRSKSGLKHELVTRALQLVQFDCSPELFKKIKELYETRYAKKSAEPALQPHRPLEPLAVHTAYGRPGAVPRTALSGPNIDYPVLYGKCLNGLGRLPPKALKPEVRLVKLPFFNMLDELLKPTELVPQNSEKLQESPCIFALTPRQVELIRNSRELQPGVKAVQVVLRICYSDASCPQEDQYPPNIAVKVNHSYCSVPGYYPSNKPGVEPKRPCRPVNLTHLMYLSSATNRITVTWGNYGKSYSVALYLVRQLTSSELLQRLKTIGVKHPELCKALVQEKLRLDPDSEIATTGVRVSLICPMNEKKPTWMCPVCDKPASYDQLIIDGLLSKILSECEDADEIEFLADGSWCPVRAEKERSCSPQCPVLVLGTPDANGLLATPNVNGGGGAGSGPGGGAGAGSSAENGKPGADVVDLTLDSSSSSEEDEDEEDEDEDEDGPRPKRRCPFQKGLVSAC
ncbi:E3 SUMO-protein ligase PIAS4 isoform X2 [Dasypus novemcinctus]|uniref:E3 SUMO-protein ligase PIAS4 isoform X2 n=1 Tax=Dasypus novemcinctus TaxID=9361 RepID=UPI00265F1F3C|nr:E3 SUMO-protein ligase PIAS4 isoform X2 [Dasypus novemcinctus]